MIEGVRTMRSAVSSMILALTVSLSPVFAAAPIVSDVTAFQQTNGSKIIEIGYVLYDSDGDTCTVAVQVSSDGGVTWTDQARTFLPSSAVGPGVRSSILKQIIRWDCAKDLPCAYGPNYRIKVIANDNAVPDDMVVIPAGTFQMGDSIGEGDYEERPVHTVTLDSFAMGRYEITNGQYCAFLKSVYPSQLKVVNGVVYSSRDINNQFPYCYISVSDTESQIAFTNNTFNVRMKGDKDMTNHPMVCVTWHGAVAYCNWRSQQEGKKTCYNLSTWECDYQKSGYRLPTEAEWEYAARGGLPHNRFPWGNSINHTLANYYSSYNTYGDTNPTWGYHPLWADGIYPYTSPVGYFAPNEFGLFDMVGNVAEWCNDWYSNSYYGMSPINNPTGPTNGTARIIRGGSWYGKVGGYVFYSIHCRLTYRRICFYGEDAYTRGAIGFRVVLPRLTQGSSLFAQSSNFKIDNLNRTIIPSAKNNWDGTVTITWAKTSPVCLIRRQVHPSQKDEILSESIKDNPYVDRPVLSQIKNRYRYVLRDSSNFEVMSNEVMPDVVVVLVRGYAPLGSPEIDENYWTTNETDQKKDKDLIADIHDWFQDPKRSFTCWDASKRLNGKKSIEWNTAELKKYIDDMREEDPRYSEAKINLIGHSLGGLISRRYAADYPDIVNKVICIETPHTGSSLVEVIGWEPFASDATMDLKPGNLEDFNDKYGHLKNVYSTWSNNFTTVLDNWKMKTGAAYIRGDWRFYNGIYHGILFAGSDGAAPSLSAQGKINNRKLGWDLYWHYEVDPKVEMVLSYECSLDHNSSYRHLSVLNKVMEWLGYPQPAPEPMVQNRIEPPSGEEAEESLYLIQGFEGTFDNTSPASEYVKVSECGRAVFRAISSDPNTSFVLIRPNSSVVDPLTPTTDYSVTYQAEDGVMVYEVRNPLPGSWTMQLTTTIAQSQFVEYGLTAFENIRITMESFAYNELTPNEPINLGQAVLSDARLSDNAGPIFGATVTARITAPDNSIQIVSLFDDGTNGDLVPDDGQYHNRLTPTQIGNYSVEMSASGISSIAGEFTRTSMTSFSVAPKNIAISGVPAEEGIDLNGNGKFDILRLTIPITVLTDGQFRLTGSLVDSNSLPITRINTGLVPLKGADQSICADVAAADIAKHGTSGPWRFINIEISDGNTGLVIASIPEFSTKTYEVTQFELLDSDGDGLPDVVEQQIGTDPTKPDTDEDGATDYQEVALDGNPNEYDPTKDSNPLVADTDGDGMSDGYEIAYGLNPLVDDREDDLDHDGLANIQEYEKHTRPDKADTDGDGLPDKWELDHGFDPLVYDTETDADLDGLSNIAEYGYGTDPRNPDTDGDVVKDGPDNCKNISNPDRKDTNGNGRGDLCDCIADLNQNGMVDLQDLVIMVDQWMNKPSIPSADFAPEIPDGKVDLADFAVLAAHWLENSN